VFSLNRLSAIPFEDASEFIDAVNQTDAVEYMVGEWTMPFPEGEDLSQYLPSLEELSKMVEETLMAEKDVVIPGRDPGKQSEVDVRATMDMWTYFGRQAFLKGNEITAAVPLTLHA
jgi:hypothetical protein